MPLSINNIWKQKLSKEWRSIAREPRKNGLKSLVIKPHFMERKITTLLSNMLSPGVPKKANKLDLEDCMKWVLKMQKKHSQVMLLWWFLMLTRTATFTLMFFSVLFQKRARECTAILRSGRFGTGSQMKTPSKMVYQRSVKISLISQSDCLALPTKCCDEEKEFLINWK